MEKQIIPVETMRAKKYSQIFFGFYILTDEQENKALISHFAISTMMFNNKLQLFS